MEAEKKTDKGIVLDSDRGNRVLAWIWTGGSNRGHFWPRRAIPTPSRSRGQVAELRSRRTFAANLLNENALDWLFCFLRVFSTQVKITPSFLSSTRHNCNCCRWIAGPVSITPRTRCRSEVSCVWPNHNQKSVNRKKIYVTPRCKISPISVYFVVHIFERSGVQSIVHLINWPLKSRSWKHVSENFFLLQLSWMWTNWHCEYRT